MRDRVRFEVTTASHVGQLLLRGLRASDEQECARLVGLDPGLWLWESFASSDSCMTAFSPAGVAAITGVRRKSALSTNAWIWMMGCDDVERFWLDTARLSALVVHYLSLPYQRVENFVDADNRVTIRWLKWLGFRFEEAPRRSAFGFPIYRFWRDTVCAESQKPGS